MSAELAPPAHRARLWRELRTCIPPDRLYERIEREMTVVLLRRVPAEDRLFASID